MSYLEDSAPIAATQLIEAVLVAKASRRQSIEGIHQGLFEVRDQHLVEMLDLGIATLVADVATRAFAGRERILRSIPVGLSLADFWPELATEPQTYILSPRVASTLVAEAGGALPIYHDGDQAIAVAAFQFAGQRILIGLGETQLTQGSRILKTIAWLFGGSGVFALALVLEPAVADMREEQHWNAQIVRNLGQDSCSLDLEARYDIKSLRTLAAQEINPFQPGLPAEVRRRRVCLVQLLLRMNKIPLDEIDGVLGPKTLEAMSDFAREKGLSERDIRAEEYFESLLDGIQRAP